MIIRSIKPFFLYLLWIGGSIAAVAQQNVDVSVQLISNEGLLEVAVSVDSLSAYIKPAITLLETSLATETRPMRVAAQFSLHPTADPGVKVLHSGGLAPETVRSLETQLAALPPYRSHLIDIHFLLVADVLPQQMKPGKSYNLDVVSPYNAPVLALKEVGLTQKAALIQQWARTYAIPVLAAFQHNTGQEFAGVRSMGQTLSSLDFSKPVNVEALTDKNPQFWRATVEMAPGNQLMPVTRLILLAANGEFDHARLYLGILGPFMDENTIAAHLAQELQYRLNIFNEDLEQQANAGIALHDKQAYKEAIALYQQLLAAYPNSAWVNYELFYSTNALAMANGQPREDRALWDAAKPSIYRCNPLYEMDVRSSNAVEGYLLFRRQKIGTLFKDPKRLDEDLQELAMIAIDLKAYGFAAQLSAMLMVRKKEFTEPFLEYFLFCLDKLGDTQLRQNFKIDHVKVFREIEKERQRAMEKDPTYKMFEK